VQDDDRGPRRSPRRPSKARYCSGPRPTLMSLHSGSLVSACRPGQSRSPGGISEPAAGRSKRLHDMPHCQRGGVAELASRLTHVVGMCGAVAAVECRSTGEQRPKGNPQAAVGRSCFSQAWPCL